MSGLAIVSGYAGLIGVNVITAKGLFGVPDNRKTSEAYPTEVTPSGPTFAIWGPIFLLEGAGTAFLASGGLAGPYGAAATGWMTTWAAQSLWQAVFWAAPLEPKSTSVARRAVSLVPAAGLLATAHACMLSAGLALKREAAARSILGALLCDLPTGLNAGWLAAASGIGITIAARLGPAPVKALATPEGGAALVYGLSGYSVLASAMLASPQTLLVALGYSAATAWACNGIVNRPVVADKVKRAAKRGVWIAAAGAVVSVAVALLGGGKK